MMGLLRKAGRSGAMALAFCLVEPAVVAAAPADSHEATAPAQRLAAEGARQLEAGHGREAVTAFRQAYALSPNPRFQYNIGIAEQSLGHDPLALEAFERFLSEAKDISSDHIAEAARQIAELRKRVADLEIVCSERDARVQVDAGDLGQTPLPRPVHLLPGRHRVDVIKAGFAPYVETVDVPRGESRLISATLEPDRPAVTAVHTPVTSTAGEAAIGAPPPARSAPGAVALGASLGLDFWSIGNDYRADPSAAFGLRGDSRIDAWSNERWEIAIGGRLGLTFLQETGGTELFWSAHVAPSVRLAILQRRLYLAAEVGLGLLAISGVDAGSALLKSDAQSADGSTTFEVRPGLTLEAPLSRSVSMALLFGLPISRRPSARYAEASLVRSELALAALYRF